MNKQVDPVPQQQYLIRIQVEPDNDKTRITLAQYFMKKGNTEMAVLLYQDIAPHQNRWGKLARKRLKALHEPFFRAPVHSPTSTRPPLPAVEQLLRPRRYAAEIGLALA